MDRIQVHQAHTLYSDGFSHEHSQCTRDRMKGEERIKSMVYKRKCFVPFGANWNLFINSLCHVYQNEEVVFKLLNYILAKEK